MMRPILRWLTRAAAFRLVLDKAGVTGVLREGFHAPSVRKKMMVRH